MHQLKVMLKRLQNPSVVMSIASQIITILLLFNIDINRSIVIGVVTAVCSILVLLGIMSNPDRQNGGFGEDIAHCEACDKRTVHVVVAGEMVCKNCGKCCSKNV